MSKKKKEVGYTRLYLLKTEALALKKHLTDPLGVYDERAIRTIDWKLADLIQRAGWKKKEG